MRVSCPSCNATYEFDAAAIPADGYNAKCTSCEKVFFVRPDKAAESSTEWQAGSELPTREQAEVMALDDELGEPAEAAGRLEDDFTALTMRRRKRNRVLAGVAVALPVIAFATLHLAPGVWDATLGPVLGIKARVHPDAIPLKDAAWTLMLSDTDEGYRQALAKLSAALEIDAQYPEAIALLALAHAFMGQDMQRRGAEVTRQFNEATATLRVLNELPADKRPADWSERVASLHASSQQLKEGAETLYQQGGDEFRSANSAIGQALQQGEPSPELLTASGLVMMAQDSEKRPQAERQLDASLKLRGRPEVDPRDPPDALSSLLKGEMERALPEKGGQGALPYYEGAVQKEPGFTRARFAIVEAYTLMGDTDRARRAAEDLLKTAPGHEKSKDYLAMIAPPPLPTPPPAVVESETKPVRRKRR
jgi:predicted Zn finger-like uncharacterized protein